uniref:AT1G27290 protein n=1 Tax=Arabidopsis thaliana TaxID=3702 RepID=C0Z2V2_ARATH|nr:AT1G27290 [Arabidopsis thaliana]
MMRRQRDEQQSRVFYDLSSLVLNLLRSPPMPISLPDHFLDSLLRLDATFSFRKGDF